MKKIKGIETIKRVKLIEIHKVKEFSTSFWAYLHGECKESFKIKLKAYGTFFLCVKELRNFLNARKEQENWNAGELAVLCNLAEQNKINEILL